MKKLRLIAASILASGLFLTSAMAAVDPSTVSTYATDPALPILGEPVTIYINVNNWNITDTATVTAYTGTVTTASDNNTGWRNVKADWSDVSIELDRENDSVFSLTIDDISDFYSIPAEEEALRIAFIARGTNAGSPSGQTSDLFIDVYSQAPTAQGQSSPTMAKDTELMRVDFNIAGSELATVLDTATIDTDVFVYTAMNSSMGDWQHEVTGWGEVDTNEALKCTKINDTIYTLWISPNVRDFYGLTSPIEVSKTVNLIVRNAAGVKGTDDVIIDLELQAPDVDVSSITDYKMYPEYPTQDDMVFLFFNVNADTAFYKPGGNISAYTGLITSESNDAIDGWQNVKNDWGVTTDTLTPINDSIFVYSIAPSVRESYAVGDTVADVYRIAFILRDSNEVKFFGGNLYFEIYGGEPTELSATQPAKPAEDGQAVYTFNINQSENTSVMDTIAGGMPTDSLYVYTWLATSSGEEYKLADWGDVSLQPLAVNDSIYRLFIMNDIRSYYSVEDTCERVYQTNFILKANIDGVQTSDIEVVVDTMDITCEDEVGFEQITKLEGVLVYPNPVNDVLYVQFDEAKSAKITFVNALGQLVFSQEIVNEQMISINVNEFANSNEILFYTIQSENKVLTQKLLVK